MQIDLSKFNPAKAAAAQKRYCEENECPHFAPYDGICYRCGRNIYMPINGDNGTVRGITVEKAGKELITGCPHCHYSYCD